MKKNTALALVLILIMTVSFSNAEGNRFTDVESGVSFDIPTGWEESPNVDNNKSIKVQYTPSNTVGQSTISFAVLDLYSAMGASQYGVSRKDIDFSFLDDDLIAAMLGPLEAKSNVDKQFGNYEYKVITTNLETTKAGLQFTLDAEMVLTLMNGYVILFQYMELNHSEEYHTVFENMLLTVKIN